jgi:hypothetical protein
MILTRPGHQVCIILFLLITLWTRYLSAQSTLHTYKGKAALFDSVSGKVSYQYFLQNKDTIKNGDYLFQHFVEYYKETDSIHGLELGGKFVQNLKHGPWHFTSKQLSISGNVSTIGTKIQYDASGKELLYNTQFQNGKVNGPYTITDRHIEESLPADTQFFVRMNYQDGLITGSLEGFMPGMKVSGQFDKDGFPDGDWIFLHQLSGNKSWKEIRFYDHGFFSRHYYEGPNGQLNELKHIGFDTLIKSGKGLLTRLPASTAYFRALDYSNIVMNVSEEKAFAGKNQLQHYISNANAFMQKTLIAPEQYNKKSVWQGVEGSDKMSPIRVKVSKFSYTEQERLLNEDNKRILDETNSLLYNCFNNSNTHTNRYINRDVGLFYEVLTVYSRQLAGVAPVINFLADSASEYVNHYEILKHTPITLNYPEKLKYVIQDTVVSASHPFPENLQTLTSESINKHLNFVFEDVRKIVVLIEKAIVNYQAQGALSIKEDRLIAMKDSVIHLFSNQLADKKYNELHAALKDSILQASEHIFQKYAQKDLLKKLRDIDSTYACLETFAAAYPTLIEYHNRLHEIDEEYTRSVWNPYTYTYMEERVKSRLYTVFEKELFPYFKNNLSRALTCHNINQKLGAMDTLLKKMQKLRMVDTKELEKQLRRKRNIDEYLTLLELKVY